MSDAGEKFVVACPNCGKRYQVPRTSEGKQGRCSCGTEFPLQAAAPSAAIGEMASRPPVGPPGAAAAAPAAHCVQHPGVPAVFACARCRALICQVCDTPQPDGNHLCPTCAATIAAPLSPWQPAGPAVAPAAHGGAENPYASPVAGTQPLSAGPYQFPQQATRTCGMAVAALIVSIVGLCICAIILCPLAIILGLNAKKAMDADPTLRGRGMATAAIIIGAVGLVLFVIAFILQIAQMSQMLKS
jgi:hypothetical protein